jgi:hypothetical protein
MGWYCHRGRFGGWAKAGILYGGPELGRPETAKLGTLTCFLIAAASDEAILLETVLQEGA